MTPDADLSAPIHADEPSPTGGAPPTGGLPNFLTVVEAARVLRIGRTSAYLLTQQWLYSDGREGLPVVRVGRQLRVPRRALEFLAAGELTPVPAPPSESPASSESAPVSRSASSVRAPIDDDTSTTDAARTTDRSPTTSPRSAESDSGGSQASLFPTDR